MVPKKKYILSLFLVLFIGLTNYTVAQRIQNLNVFVAGTNVVVKFSIGTGTQCSGYKILHSLDSTYFNVVFDYPGICGTSATPEEISYTHTGPSLNQTNFYKVELVPIETSLTKRVFVPEQKISQLLVYPNPVTQLTDLLNLKIANAGKTRLIGFVYNQAGKPIKQLDVTTINDATNINIFDLNNGLYVVWLTDGFQVFSKKFIINR